MVCLRQKLELDRLVQLRRIKLQRKLQQRTMAISLITISLKLPTDKATPSSRITISSKAPATDKATSSSRITISSKNSADKATPSSKMTISSKTPADKATPSSRITFSSEMSTNKTTASKISAASETSDKKLTSPTTTCANEVSPTTCVLTTDIKPPKATSGYQLLPYHHKYIYKLIMGFPSADREPGVVIKLLSAGLGGCSADLVTFPLDTVKVRLQVQNVKTAIVSADAIGGGALLGAAKYRGVAGTLLTIAREEGPRALYGGLAAGLQRQLCFASVRIGGYDATRDFYAGGLNVTESSSKASQLLVRIAAGLSTGGMSVLIAQPTDVVKIRMQASGDRYSGCINAYTRIARAEGLHGLWKGTSANIARTAVVNVCEVVSYDLLKSFLLSRHIMSDRMPCHFTAAFGAGFITTVIASPVDVVKTRFMNSPSSYSNVLDCAVQMMRREGATAFYKGFWPSFLRLSSWSVCLFVSMEQFKRAFLHATRGFN